jgi:sterol desaturase/sphingolipid hydroxylase (fatty acid hydroxylase superfamily)
MRGQRIRRLFDAALVCILKMSRTPANYWGEFVLDIPIGFLLIFEGLRHPGTHPPAVFFTILIGLFLFSFFEYFFHRWLFHGSMRLMVEGHRAHHENPLGYDALPFFLPALLLMGLVGIFVLLIPVSYAFLLAGSMASGYVTYGLSHFIIHHTRFRRRMARRWAANHHIHHYHPDTNFGVTTPLWDIVLSTRYVRQYKRI